MHKLQTKFREEIIFQSSHLYSQTFSVFPYLTRKRIEMLFASQKTGTRTKEGHGQALANVLVGRLQKVRLGARKELGQEKSDAWSSDSGEFGRARAKFLVRCY